MKRFFKLVSMFVLAGATLTYTGCTDYDKDIDAINDRIDKLESSTTGELNSIKEQIKGMDSQISALEAARDNALKEIEDLKKTDESLGKLVGDLKAQHEKDIQKLTADYKKAVEDLKAIHDADKAALEKALDEAKKDFASKLAALEKTHAEDIAALDAQIRIIQGEIDGLKGSVNGINDAIANINKTIETLASKKDLEDHKAYAEATYATKAAVEEAMTAIGNLKGRMDAVERNLSNTLKSLVALSERVGDAEVAIEAAKLAANKAQATAENAQKAAEDAQATADKALGNIQSLRDALGVYANYGALAAKFQAIQSEMEATKAANEKAIKDLKEADDRIYDILKCLIDETDETLRSLIESKLSALETKLTNRLNDIDSLISDLNDNKLDIDDFADEFDMQLGIALSEGGRINEAIAESISALNTAIGEDIDDINDELETINGKLELITGILENLADRIQSLVFVPEYNDGMASAKSYVLATAPDVSVPGKTVLSEDVVVKGTFKVTPAKLGKTVEAYAKAGKVYVKAVSTKPRTRGAEKDVDAKKVSVVASQEGRLEVEATFPSSVISVENNPMIALYVETAAEEVEGEGEEPRDPLEDIDTKNYVSSAYVPVNIEEVNLFKNFVLYNGTKEYAAEEIEKQWSEWKGSHTFADGYTPYLKVEDGYYTPAQVEEMYALPEGCLVPTPFRTLVYRDASNTVLNGAKEYIAITKAVAEGWETTVEMAAPTKEKAMDYVGYNMTNFIGLQFTLGKVGATGTVKCDAVSYESSYEIVRRHFDITIEPASVDWNYANAVALSTSKTVDGLYKKPIGQDFDRTFSELDVTIPSVDVAEINLDKILAGALTPKHTLTVNGIKQETAGSVTLKVDPVAILKHKIASVEVSGYAFSNKGVSVYGFCNTYANDATKTDVNVKFNLTLGAVPTVETIDLGEQVINYVPNVTYHDVTEAATAKAAFEKVATYFDKYETFAKDFTDGAYTTVVNTAKRTSAKPEPETVRASKFDPINFAGEGGHKHFIKLSHEDVSSYSDTYQFSTSYETWYGVKYTFTTTAKLEQPKVALDYFGDWVATDDNGTRFATLKGKVEGGKYVIVADDLSKYFHVNGVAASGINPSFITVDYEVLTKEDTEEGIINLPTVGTGKAVSAAGQIEATEVPWGDYTAQSLLVEATLKVNDIAVNSKEIDLRIEDPVVKFVANPIKTTRVPHKAKVVNLWSGMEVYGRNNSNVNLVDNAAASIADMWKYNADEVYDLVLTFDKTSYTVMVGGVDKTAEYSDKIELDTTDWTITYKADAAEQVLPVYVMIDATLTHKYGYDGKKYHPVTVRVVFNEPAE